MKKNLLSFFVMFMSLSAVNAQWSLNGNAGTNPPTNFIGTTDFVNFVIKTNNQQSGIIDLNLYNTAFGYMSAVNNTTGNYNTAYGYRSLQTQYGRWLSFSFFAYNFRKQHCYRRKHLVLHYNRLSKYCGGK
jgi:hypothetical protein